MRRWSHRLVRSRRLRAVTLAAIGLLTMGSCGGALLANYTVAGMDPVYVARAEPDPRPQPGAADWLAEEAFRTAERNGAAFADPWKAEPAEAD